MDSGIEIIDKKKLRLNERSFDIHYHNPPLSDGSIFGLDADGANSTYAKNHLKPYELRGIQGRWLPAGLYISIDSPKSHLKNMSLVHFENIKEGPVVKSWIYFVHADWHLPISLHDFCEMLRDEIANNTSVVSHVGIELDDSSVTLVTVAPIGPSSYCYEVFQALDEHLLKSYRTCLRSLMRDTPIPRKKVNEASSGDAHGLKWWMRYVAVPIIVGLIALAAVFLRG